MKINYINLFFVLTLLFFVEKIKAQGLEVMPCTETKTINTNHPKANELKALMQELVKQSIPGVVMSIEDKNGVWENAEGYAKLEDLTPLQPCHLQYLGSIPKLYMATVIMKLWEEGKIDLNAPISQYLPMKMSKQVPNSEKITVKMLLNHTSGINEYNDVSAYICQLLQEPKRIFQPEEYLQYIGKKPDFEAGSRYSYRNINYVLLSLIADQLTGNHADYMRKTIFKPLGMSNTFYRIEQGNTYDKRLVNTYWDRYSNNILENSSVLLNTNTASMAGDDGVVCTPADAILFLKGLIQGKIVSEKTLAMMQEWVSDRKGNKRYGLGFAYMEMAGMKAIGHSGGGLGTGCQLYYLPEKKVFIFTAINLGTVTETPIFKEAEKTIEKIYQVLVK
ncbi:MAG: class A beta-lactamase-related serine hydrolase [Cytophagales bacterium]|nr:MAG: class A beta-lactamase-related serine hydrolase [Cytophagales bacterium]